MTRHDLPRGVAASFLIDGDSEHSRTGQWRVIAPDEATLRSAVAELLGEMAAAGIGVGEPQASGSLCLFRDRGPWAMTADPGGADPAPRIAP